MDTQTAFNIVLTLASFFGGWVLNNLKESIRNLQESYKALADKVQHIEVLVAGQYVKRDDLEKMISAVFTKLDKIESKLDGKADK